MCSSKKSFFLYLKAFSDVSRCQISFYSLLLAERFPYMSPLSRGSLRSYSAKKGGGEGRVGNCSLCQ